MKAAQLKITNSKVFLLEIIPLGISRMAVRGFNASKFLSSQRLKAIAALLEKTIHSTTSKNNCHHGFWVINFVCANATKKPIKAKGIAKMV